MVIVFLFVTQAVTAYGQGRFNSYPWLEKDDSVSIGGIIDPPAGFNREPAVPNSFEAWLRNLPLKKGHPPVHLFDGSLKINQGAHFTVLDIDVGSKDLQQCADAVIRLRAEYLYSMGQFRKISFNFTSGDKASFENWLEGYRPIITGNKVRWKLSAAPDSSYGSFRSYLDVVFQYAGTYSLKKELEKVPDIARIQIGDIFIKGGFPGGGSPGHAVIVVDVASDSISGQQIFLLAQSYMPAQEIHILKNLIDIGLSPWYKVDISRPLQTPEWIFEFSDLMRFR